MKLIDVNNFLKQYSDQVPGDTIDVIDLRLALLKEPTVEAIPIEWIKKYIEDNTQLMINPKYENTEFTEEPIDYYVKLYPYQIDTMLREWEKEK